jgi:hypothetical protein
MAEATFIEPEELTSSIAKLLHTFVESGDFVAVYKEYIPQNAVKPYISIEEPIATFVSEMRDRGEVAVNYLINFHPKDKEERKRSWSRKWQHYCFLELHRVPFQGGKLKCRQFTGGMQDDILHVEAEYSYKAKIIDISKEPDAIMETLETDIDAKERTV